MCRRWSERSMARWPGCRGSLQPAAASKGARPASMVCCLLCAAWSSASALSRPGPAAGRRAPGPAGRLPAAAPEPAQSPAQVGLASSGARRAASAWALMARPSRSACMASMRSLRVLRMLPSSRSMSCSVSISASMLSGCALAGRPHPPAPPASGFAIAARPAGLCPPRFAG